MSKEIIKLSKISKKFVGTNKDIIILKNIKNKSIKNKIDPKITTKIWKTMIWSYVDYQKRNFKKK